MVCCSAPNCSNSSRRGYRLFRFPSEKSRRAIWLQNCRRDKWSPTSTSRLCEVHFEENQWEHQRADGWKRLKPNATPTLFKVPNPPSLLTSTRRSLHKVMATENSESHLPAMPESDAIEKLEQKSNSEVTIEPRVPLQEDLNDKYIKAEGSDIVKDAGFEFVDYRTLIKQERNSEENPFPNTTYSTSENLMSEMERDSKDIHIDTETFKAELSDSATNTEFEAEAETVPLKAETATSSQDMKVEIETIPIIDNEHESGSTTEAAAKLQPENAGTTPKSLFQGVLPADKQHRCTTCSRGFQLRADLLIHTILEHSVDDRLVCPICSKSSFSNRGSLFRHIRDHTAEHSVQCSICSKSFKRKETYILHMRTHTGELPFQCDTCGKCFYHKGLLIQHLRIHNGEHSFKCATCGKTFVCKGELSKHARIHSGIRPHKCDICGKGFLRKEMLADHTRLHTGVRPFVCPICGKCFPGKGYLQKHNLVHTGERRHMCSVCSARFARKGHLMRHMGVHSGERPYRCDLCDKTFQHKHQVTRHLVMHDENAFQCAICEKAFRKKFLLNRHLKIHMSKKCKS